MSIKHLKPRSKWEVRYNHVIDFIKNIPKLFRRKNHFPLINVVGARSLGLDLVSVQPMSKPTGIFYYLDYVYNNKEDEYKTLETKD